VGPGLVIGRGDGHAEVLLIPLPQRFRKNAPPMPVTLSMAL
jgi:hypothetical protein